MLGEGGLRPRADLEEQWGKLFVMALPNVPFSSTKGLPLLCFSVLANLHVAHHGCMMWIAIPCCFQINPFC